MTMLVGRRIYNNNNNKDYDNNNTMRKWISIAVPAATVRVSRLTGYVIDTMGMWHILFSPHHCLTARKQWSMSHKIIKGTMSKRYC
mgnify:CR=1 FL=1